MKKQKLLAILFCAALIVGAVSTASAQQTELLGTVYRLAIYSSAGVNLNADITFQADDVFIVSIGAGSGTYFDLSPAYVATYSALGATLADLTGDISMYFAGYLYGDDSESTIGVGLARIKGVDDPITFLFTGKRIATAG
jgi:hypothetical protein